MLGFRGCRLGIHYPEITEMQARAVFEAAADAKKKGYKAKPEIMIPLVGFKKELDLQVEVVHEVARKVQAERKTKINYSVGTMIEVPRGALTADEIAETAEFFSFGTNDLTQTTLGMSRDDSGSFLPPYEELEIVKKNPFATIDQTGVGAADADRGREGPQDPPGHQAGHLRRARRRSGLGEVLPRDRPRLRQLLAVPRARRAAGGRTGGHRRAQEVGGERAPGEMLGAHLVSLSADALMLRLRAHGSRLREHAEGAQGGAGLAGVSAHCMESEWFLSPEPCSLEPSSCNPVPCIHRLRGRDSVGRARRVRRRLTMC